MPAYRPGIVERSLFIDNGSRAALDGERLEVIDPSDGAVFGSIARGRAADVGLAVASARRAFDGNGTADGPWGRTPHPSAGASWRAWAGRSRTPPRNSRRWNRATPASHCARPAPTPWR